MVGLRRSVRRRLQRVTQAQACRAAVCSAASWTGGEIRLPHHVLMIQLTATLTGRVSAPPAGRTLTPVAAFARVTPVATLCICVHPLYPFPEFWVAWIVTPPPYGSGDHATGVKP